MRQGGEVCPCARRPASFSRPCVCSPAPGGHGSGCAPRTRPLPTTATCAITPIPTMPPRRARGSRWCGCAASRPRRATTPFAPSSPTRRCSPSCDPASSSASSSARARSARPSAYREFLEDFGDGELAERARGNLEFLEADGFGARPDELAAFAERHPDERFRRRSAAQRRSGRRAQSERLPERRVSRWRSRPARRVPIVWSASSASARCGATRRRESRWFRSTPRTVRARRRCPCASRSDTRKRRSARTSPPSAAARPASSRPRASR